MPSDALILPFGVAVAPAYLDAESLVAALHEAARQKALDAFGSQRSLTFKPLELETRLWDLVARIVDNKAHKSSSSAPVVIEWLQKNLRAVAEPSNLQSIKWMYTKNQAAKPRGNAVVSELDLDAPLRQALPISEEDREADETFFRYVFELLLCGDRKRAQAVCADTNNWLLRAAVSVTTPTDVFATACKQLSSDHRVGKWEAAVYGLVCGNLAVVAPLCDSWEKLLLVHLQAGASLQTFELAVQRDHKLLLQHQDWIHQVAIAVIQERVPELVVQLASQVQSSDRSAVLVVQPHLTRILLHLQLVLGLQAGVPQIDTTLAQVYLEYICDSPEDLPQTLPLVPEYVRFLSSESQSRVYGYILAQITDPDTQAHQLRLASEYTIDVAPALEHAVALNFDLSSEHNEEAAHGLDVRLVGILNWLVIAELWPLAVKSLLRAYIFFYTQGRRAGAVLLASQISAEYARSHALDGLRTKLQDYPDLVNELNQLRDCAQLAEALAALDAWHQLDHTNPGWRSSAAKVIGFAIESVSNALNFGAAATTEDIVLIRRKYIPLITYELLDVLSAAQSVSEGYATVALEFAIKIADEDLKLYELFDVSLLSALAKPALCKV